MGNISGWITFWKKKLIHKKVNYFENKSHCLCTEFRKKHLKNNNTDHSWLSLNEFYPKMSHNK